MSNAASMWPPQPSVVDVDYDTLDPGIRSTVRWLRERGFDTCDSGDGRTKFEAAAAAGEPLDPNDNDCGIAPFPHVAMRVHPDRLVEEADRLCGLLIGAGVKIEPLGPDGGPSIQASYDPGSTDALIYLSHVTIGDP